MPEPLSLNLVHLKPSETIAISAETKRRRAAGEEVFDLSLGEPDFDTPMVAAQAGITAIQKGMTHYPPNPGIPELRVAIAKNLSLLSGGRPVNADNILISSGSKHSLFNACFTLFGPNDQVLIPAPAWVSYPQIVHLCRAEPILVPGDIEWGLKVGAKELDNHSTTRTKGLILCSPCNPTGAVYTLPELKAIAEWAKKNDVWIIADEIYRRINYGAKAAPSFLDLPDDLLERTVVICGASKAYAMTGWRIGAALAPTHVFKGMAALQSHTTTGANHPAQWASATAFSDERVEADVLRMVAAFRGAPRSPGGTVPLRGARRGVRGAARRLLLLLPGGRADRARGRRRRLLREADGRGGRCAGTGCGVWRRPVGAAQLCCGGQGTRRRRGPHSQVHRPAHRRAGCVGALDERRYPRRTA